jgi:toxin ParE1/3/4
VTEIVITRRAVADLDGIWTYIAADSPGAADRLLLAIDEKITLLATFPEIGPRRDDIQSGLRMLVHGRYLVLYEFHRERDVVEIVAVVAGMRDLGDLF